MNWTTLQGNWNETKGKVKSKFGRLTDDDLMQVQGQRDRLVGVIQQKYGIAREKAEEQLDEFLSGAESFVGRAQRDCARTPCSAPKKRPRMSWKKAGSTWIKAATMSNVMSAKAGTTFRTPALRTWPGTSATLLPAIRSRARSILGIGLGFLIGRLLTPSNRS